MGRHGNLDLRLRTPHARSPRSAGLSEDVRQLGFFLTELTVSPARTPGSASASTSPGAKTPTGIWPADGGRSPMAGAVTGDQPAKLLLRVDRQADGLELELEAVPVPGQRRPLRLSVGVDGNHQAWLIVGDDSGDRGARAVLGAVRAGQEIALSLAADRTVDRRISAWAWTCDDSAYMSALCETVPPFAETTTGVVSRST